MLSAPAPSSSPKSLGSVLIVGGCGFLGHHIVSQLLTSYSTSTLSVLDLHTSRNRFPNVTYHNADITSPSAVRAVLEQSRPQVIIHTASPAAIGAGNHDLSALYRKVNIEGTRVLVREAGQLGGVQAFVYTSSASIIHDTVGDLRAADERWPVLRGKAQVEYYSETKAIAEEVVLAANRKDGGMLTVALRPAGIFGEGDVQMFPPILRAYEQGSTNFQLGDGDNLYDFTYVGNVAHAHILAAVALIGTYERGGRPVLDYEKVDGEAFLITNDQPVYLWDWTRAIWAAAGETRTVAQTWVLPKGLGLMIAGLMDWVYWIGTMGRKKPNLTRRIMNYTTLTRCYSCKKAKERLGYKPVWTLDEGFERTIEWFRSGGNFKMKGARVLDDKKAQ